MSALLNPYVRSVVSKVVCSTLCPGCQSNLGDDSKLFLPTSFPQLQEYAQDLEWVNATLRHQGVIDDKIKCTKMVVTPFNDGGGFFSELAAVAYEYDDMALAEERGIPMKAIAKFLPQQIEKRITLGLFNLGSSEIYAYADIFAPELISGATMGKSETKPKVEQAKAMMTGMAQLHASFWGAKDPSLTRINSIYNPNYEMGAQKMKALIPMFLGQCRQHGVKVPSELVDGVFDKFQSLIVPILRFASTSQFMTLLHGDARLDNWYFDNKTGEPGIFDFQQMMKGPCYVDVSWCLTNSYPAEFVYEHREMLLELYWTSLMANLKEKDVDTRELHFEDFLYGFKLFLVFCLGKNILAVEALVSSTDEHFLKIWDGDEVVKNGLLFNMIGLTMDEFMRLEGAGCVEKLLAGTISHTGHQNTNKGKSKGHEGDVPSGTFTGSAKVAPA